MYKLHRDYETRSVVDLKKTGQYPYFTSATTHAWCCSYAVDDGAVDLWQPGDPVPEVFKDAARFPADWTVWAHNDAFERRCEQGVMVPRFGFPEFPLEMHRCTMVMAAAMGLPQSLENAAGAVGLDLAKDMAGFRLMQQMARPRRIDGDADLSDPALVCIERGFEQDRYRDARGRESTVTWWGDADRRRRLGGYCIQDTEVERALEKRLLPLSDAEQKLWFLDQTVNDRGMAVDVNAARKAKILIEKAKRELDREMRRVTGRKVASCTAVAQIIEFLGENGIDAKSISKDQIVDLLGRKDLPDNCRRVLELRREASKSSTAKLNAIIEMAGPDNRVRGTFQYHGAATGRWAGRGIQPHNLPRDMPKPDAVRWYFDGLYKGPEWLDLVFGPNSFTDITSRCLRSFITAAPGRELAVADFSAIEARVLAWLAGQQDILDVFATGADVYCHAASPIYGVEVNKKDHPAERQVGKVAVLSLGYQGGIGAFGQMAKNYGVDMTPVYPRLWAQATPEEREKAEKAYTLYCGRAAVPVEREFGLAADITKQRWRAANSKITAYWYALEDAVLAAVQRPDSVQQVGKVRFRTAGSFLWCQLPSGRCVCYPYPRVVETELPWTDAEGNAATKPAVMCKTVDGVTKKWVDRVLYGGLLAENVTQAVARDLLAEAMVRAEAAGYPVVLHVHDEVVSEVPEGTGDKRFFEALMADTPRWAEGCPVSAEGFVTKRYRK